MSPYEIADNVVASRPKIIIRRMLIIETGTYTRQVNRPLKITLDNVAIESLGRRIEETNAQTFNASLLNSAGTRLLEPDMYSDSLVDIVNGWGERRCRFVLEVDIIRAGASRVTNFYQGYTDRLDESHSGELADDTEFIINSFMSSTVGDRGIPRLRRHSQILSGDFGDHDVYSARPYDVGLGLQSNVLRNTFATREGLEYNDTRIKPIQESLSSDRRNNIPTNYLSKLIKSHYSTAHMTDFGADHGNMIDEMVGHLSENELNEDDFLRQLNHMVGHGAKNWRSVKFMIKDLFKMDPDLHDEQIEYRRLGRTNYNRLSSRGDSADWDTNLPETMWATVLSNTIPALMIESAINKIDFTVHNLGMGGHVQLEIDPESYELMGDFRIQEILPKFKFALETEVLNDLSLRGNILYDIRCVVNLGTEARIDISLNEAEEMRYVSPIFADSMISSAYSVSSDRIDRLFGGVENLLERLPDLSSKSSGRSNIITNLSGI